MENLKQAIEQIQRKISAKKSDAQTLFNESDKLRARAQETMAEVNGLVTALDLLKDVK